MARTAPRHAAPSHSTAHRALRRAGLALTAAGLTLGAGATAASAAERSPMADVPGPAQVLADSAAAVVAPVTDLKLDPLAGTGSDPLDNGVGTQIADFKPLSTAALTAPLSGGASLSDLTARTTGALGG
ncbi:hypothetical protein [Streptomyces sp. NPDC050560]|uniref:hypothetical protein n=1 Tax=Streptomyces sp. NPDC050560 TaxID=3365630 RepID=UPI0037AA95A1